MRIKKKLFQVICLLVIWQMGVKGQEDLPRNAVSGKCYVKCYPADNWTPVIDEVLVQEAYEVLFFVPAVYETVEEKVIIKDAYTVLTIEPPQFNTVAEQIMVKDTSSRLVYVPAVFTTIIERVLVKPATHKWIKGEKRSRCIDPFTTDCRVWCLEEIPAQYKAVHRQVLTQPAKVQRLAVLAKYRTVTKAVLQAPSQSEKRVIPAKYRTINKQKLVSAATTHVVQVPAQYEMVKLLRIVSTGCFTDWVEVDCGTLDALD